MLGSVESDWSAQERRHASGVPRTAIRQPSEQHRQRHSTRSGQSALALFRLPQLLCETRGGALHQAGEEDVGGGRGLAYAA